MNKKRIKEITCEIVENFNVLPIEVIIRGNANNPVFEIFVDNEKGVTTDDCTNISREINKVFESDDSIPTKYRLDVSSPGIDRPLKFLNQFNKHIGRNFELSYEQNGKKQKFTGKLKNIKDSKLIFKSNKTELLLQFEDITKAKVLASF